VAANDVVATRTLGRAGSAQIALAPQAAGGFGTLRGRRIVVRATASAPGGLEVATRRAVSVVRKRRSLPLPPILAASARVRGDRVVAGWRTAVPARRVAFVAILLHSKRLDAGSSLGFRQLGGRGRSLHRVILVPDAPIGRVRWVALFAESLDSSKVSEPTLIRVR
jgi:hypothetical protein